MLESLPVFPSKIILSMIDFITGIRSKGEKQSERLVEVVGCCE